MTPARTAAGGPSPRAGGKLPIRYRFSVPSRWIGGLFDLLYPPVCHLCYRRLRRGDRTLCPGCSLEIRLPARWRCDRCGAHGSDPDYTPESTCRLCPPRDSPYRGVLAVVGYNDASQQCVHLFKYARRLEIGNEIARRMAEDLAEPIATLGARLQIAAPVPLHPLRRLACGFNQSHLLGRTLAAAHGIPYAPRLLVRRRFTRRQALLPRERRAENVRGAFALRAKSRSMVDGKGVLIIDDVITTGSTVRECARVVMDAGAREVWIACFARSGLR